MNLIALYILVDEFFWRIQVLNKNFVMKIYFAKDPILWYNMLNEGKWPAIYCTVELLKNYLKSRTKDNEWK